MPGNVDPVRVEPVHVRPVLRVVRRDDLNRHRREARGRVGVADELLELGHGGDGPHGVGAD